MNIIGFVLTNILSAPSIFYIARGNILLFFFFIASARSYVSFSSFSYRITKKNRTTIVMFGWYNKKERRSRLSSDISYMILKRRDDTNREGNSITNAHVTRGP
jgi:hypothetical protein